MNQPLEVTFNTGGNLYGVIHGVVAGTRQVWNPTLNTGAGGWEAFNGAHWTQYAIPLAEQGSSGYYAADYPANIGEVITSEVFYNNPAPTMGDSPISNPSYSQGRNMVGIAGDAVAAANQRDAAGAMPRGAATGTPTNSVIPTDLDLTLANAVAGRSVIFTTGAAADCSGRIIAYNPVNGALTLAAPLAVAPVATDHFVIV